MKSFIIERPETHHVIISDQSFALEHPLDCDMKICDIMEVLRAIWTEKPTDNGRYQVSFLEGIPMLGQELEYRRYKVKPLR